MKAGWRDFLPMLSATVVILLSVTAATALWRAGAAWLSVVAVIAGAAMCLALIFWRTRRAAVDPRLPFLAESVSAADAMLITNSDNGDLNSAQARDRQIDVSEVTLASYTDGRVMRMLGMRRDLQLGLIPAYLRRYLWSGAARDLERAVRHAQDALAVERAAAPRALLQLWLSFAQREQYWRSGDPAALGRAIDYRRLAGNVLVNMLPRRFEDHFALAELFQMRYEQSGALDDAAEMQRNLATAFRHIELPLEDAPGEIGLERALCIAARATQSVKAAELADALRALDSAMSMCANDTIRHVRGLRAYARSQSLYAATTMNVDGIAATLSSIDAVTETLPRLSPSMPALLRERAYASYVLWQLTGNPIALTRACAAIEHALSLLPERCPERAAYQREQRMIADASDAPDADAINARDTTTGAATAQK